MEVCFVSISEYVEDGGKELESAVRDERRLEIMGRRLKLRHLSCRIDWKGSFRSFPFGSGAMSGTFLKFP
jgi:hypothetical protein